MRAGVKFQEQQSSVFCPGEDETQTKVLAYSLHSEVVAKPLPQESEDPPSGPLFTWASYYLPETQSLHQYHWTDNQSQR